MTAMERAINSLSDPKISLPDALRTLLVVAHRIGAGALASWIRKELGGYEDGDDVPEYRDGSSLPVAIRFDGYGGSFVTRRMSLADLPDELTRGLKSYKMPMPLAELEALASGDGDSDPQRQLPAWWLARFRELAEEGRVPHMAVMTANHAAVVIPRTFLSGLLDRIKTVALDLALEIEDVSPDAGVAGGPTIDSQPELGAAVRSHMTMIFASNSNISVASGEGAYATQVGVGDIEGLLTASRSILDEVGVQELENALNQDGGEPAEETRRFLSRVRSGGYALVGGVAVNGAYDGLVALLGQVFPGFS